MATGDTEKLNTSFNWVCEECDNEFLNENKLMIHTYNHEKPNRRKTKFAQEMICKYLNELPDEDVYTNYYECKEDLGQIEKYLNLHGKSNIPLL